MRVDVYVFSVDDAHGGAARVIEIRLRMMSAQALRPKCFLWLSEKMDAMEEAKAIIARGGKPSLVIKITRRLSRRMSPACHASTEIHKLLEHESERPEGTPIIRLPPSGSRLSWFRDVAADGFGLMCIHHDQPDGVPPLPERYRVRRNSNTGVLAERLETIIAPTEFDIWKGRPMPDLRDGDR